MGAAGDGWPATAAQLSSGGMEPAPWDGGGVRGAILKFVRPAMSTKLSSWPRRGLRLSKDLGASRQQRGLVMGVKLGAAESGAGWGICVDMAGSL